MMSTQNSPKHLKIRLRRVFAFCAVALFMGGCVILEGKSRSERNASASQLIG